MKNHLHTKYLPVIMAALGCAGFGLRRLLYLLTEDGKGLISVGHPLEWALWAVTAAAVILALQGTKHREEPFSGGFPLMASAAGCVAAAIGIGLTVLLNAPASSGVLGMVWKILGVMSFASLTAAAKQRWEGKQPFFLLNAVVCVFLAVHTVSSYRGWSSNPQVMDYVFTLCASIALMLFAYQQGACAVDCGKHRLLLCYGLLAVFFCAVCLSGTEYPLLYLTGGIWALTNLTLPAPAEETEDGAA